MILLRSSVYFVFLVLSIIAIGLPISIIGWVLPFSINSRLANLWGRLNLFLLKWICNLDYRITGLEHLEGGNAIILSKHQSAWETIALRSIIPHNQSWVLKRELMWIPVFGWALAVIGPIAINRKAGREAAKQVVDQGIERLKRGLFVIIFPEGTRVAPGERKKYGIGGALLAEKSGYPVIPVAHNAGVFWRRRDLKKYPGTIEVVIGPRIETQGLSLKEINQRVEEWIESTVEQLPGSIEKVEQVSTNSL
ncbi:MAG: 1-acyl-sn-glycerol-3-phosphate acyltransferase [Chromatiales bacterium]|nr:1-acyl-sn-glycerol-3-phosphate acyltransferase [Chromatiales bacterium]